MRFHLEHTIAAPLPAVEAAVLDPARLAAAARVSPVLTSVVVEDLVSEGARVERRARFAVQGLRAKVGAWFPLDRIEWHEDTVYRRPQHTADFVITPVLPGPLARRVRARGQYRLRAAGPITERVIDGEIGVTAPVFGPRIERAAVALLEEHFGADPALLADWARRQGGNPAAAGTS